MKVLMFILLTSLTVLVIASPFGDELPSGAFGGGTITADTFMDGNNFCLGSTINGWCMVQDSNTDFSLNWNSVSKLSVADSSGDLTIQGDIYPQSYTYLDGNSICVGSDSTGMCMAEDGSGSVAFFINGSKKQEIKSDGVIYVPTRLETPQVINQLSPLNLGTSASTSHSLVSGDVLVGGKLEVDDQAFFDSPVGLPEVWLKNDVANWGGIVAGTDDGIRFATGADGVTNNNFIVTTTANRAKDHDHDTLSANPTVFFHSVTDPDTDNTQWGSLTHDTSSFVIDSGTSQVDIQDLVYDSTAALNLGTSASTSHSLVSGDVLVGGKLEVDGVTYIDASLYAKNITFDVLNDYGIITRFGDDGTRFLAGINSNAGNRNIIFGDASQISKDFDHDTLSPNPTVFFHSAADPDTDNTQWGSLTHDQSAFVIDSGTGPIKLNKAPAYNEQFITSSTTADETIAYNFVTASSADITITMPTASTCHGSLMTFTRLDGTTWDVILSASEGIGSTGATTYNLNSQDESQDIRCSPTNDKYYLH